MTVEWLSSDAGRSAIAALRGADPLRARQLLPDFTAEQVGAALTQAKHRPEDFPLLLVTSEGVQMATPVPVALRRAQRLAEQGVTHVIDAGCGIGVDAWAFATAGIPVTAYEKDPFTAEVARANLAQCDVEVIEADVMSVDLPPGTLYVDPARRRPQRQVTGEALRINNPAEWSPPWPWVLDQAANRGVVARVRPGMRELPSGIEWQCTSVRRRLVDACIWFPPLALVDRRACVLDGNQWHELTGPARRTTTSQARRFIVDPDPAIVRAGLVSNLAEIIGGHLLDEHLAFVTCDEQPPGWAGAAMQVEQEVAPKRIRQAARELQIRRATTWARGFTSPPSTGLPEGRDGIVVLARLGPQRQTRCWIGRPVQ